MAFEEHVGLARRQLKLVADLRDHGRKILPADHGRAHLLVACDLSRGELPVRDR